MEYIQRVESGVAERLDVLEAIRAIEDADDSVEDDLLAPGPLDDDELPSGDELASEIERFLRGQ